MERPVFNVHETNCGYASLFANSSFQIATLFFEASKGIFVLTASEKLNTVRSCFKMALKLTVSFGIVSVGVGMVSFFGMVSVWANNALPENASKSEKAIVFVFIIWV